jgi:hypothetical protein
VSASTSAFPSQSRLVCYHARQSHSDADSPDAYPASQYPQHYNVEKQISIDSLIDLLELEGEHVLVGDWNLHHEWWDGKKAEVKTCLKARELFETFKHEYKIVLLTEKGVKTWQKAPRSHLWSTIDLVFVTSGQLPQPMGSFTFDVADLIILALGMRFSSRVRNDLPTNSDYFSVETDADPLPDRVLTPRPDWNNADDSAICASVMDVLCGLDARPMSTATELDARLDSVIAIL